jgi:mono/diheme cytochrome c family protein
MNYPVWDVAFGSGLLIAVVAILHVFVSHFAVGSGLFLVLTELKAARSQDAAWLQWLKVHTRFFVLISVVFGALSGVGIWFTIGLIQPTATGNLIHIFVWAWAIEWVFFFLEITAALLYLYGWDRLEPRRHRWFGWIYFLTALLSMVVINGIITFMLTPGRWLQERGFWGGFFNPTYFPSLFLRFCIALALAGIYALITASRQRDAALKARIVRWCTAWVVPPFVLFPFLVRWYLHYVPSELWASARGAMPTATQHAGLAVVFAAATCAVALLALMRPGRFHLAHALLVACLALGAMGSFEFVREAIRKPYVIANYLYGNSLYANPMSGDGGFTADRLDRAGVLHTAKWLSITELTPANLETAGREIFRVECQACHTANAYRSVKKLMAARHWDEPTIQAMLGSLDLMHNGVMPPFSGTAAERAALAGFLGTLNGESGEARNEDGSLVFQNNCAVCHRAESANDVFATLNGMAPADAVEAVKDLPGLFPPMPDLKLSEPKRAALIRWVNRQPVAKK